MRLLELEINNVCSIRHLTINPEGRNFVVWEPNGSGRKSILLQQIYGRGIIAQV